MQRDYRRYRIVNEFRIDSKTGRFTRGLIPFATFESARIKPILTI